MCIRDRADTLLDTAQSSPPRASCCWRCVYAVHSVLSSIGRWSKAQHPEASTRVRTEDRAELKRLQAKEALREHRRVRRITEPGHLAARFRADEDSEEDEEGQEDPLDLCMDECHMFGPLNMNKQQGGLLGYEHWTVQYCVLQGPWLFWWHDQDDQAPAGSMHLSQVCRVVEFEDEPAVMFGLQQRHDSASVLCYEAFDQSERDRWVAALEQQLSGKVKMQLGDPELMRGDTEYELYLSMACVAKRIMNPSNRLTGGFS
eukprot:TRINITY_DN16538_c0_g1_i2.p2 TRINITY_DN16538_c0_g1~~TRINITY_DN16538_c0_g1_i2.p2  ORF type:complete len:259 (-),score=86.84 TRINITY_DN16538_c0_g1_i2:119-895(-)